MTHLISDSTHVKFHGLKLPDYSSAELIVSKNSSLAFSQSFHTEPRTWNLSPNRSILLGVV